MAYNLEKMRLPEIKMLFEVLEEVRIACSSRDNAFVMWGKDKQTKNVSNNDLIHIVGTLNKEGYLKRNFWLTSFLGTSIAITKKFEPFYYAVAKRMNILQQKNRPIQKSNGEDLSLEFISKTGILYFKKFKIKMTLKNQKSNAHYVMEHIFTSEDEFDDGIGRQFDYADIAWETFKDDYGRKKDAWRKYHRACEDIQEKVRKASGIEDFLDFTSGRTGWVKINEKYLE
ncbi:MAG: hypothetical protein NT170_03470 [Candidatus Moranbacteria bacterium]|nr:hypothetical protein [Candidatus Moranbacteria bacterium]